MMASRRVRIQPDYGRGHAIANRALEPARSSTTYTDISRSGYDTAYYATSSAPYTSTVTATSYSPIPARVPSATSDYAYNAGASTSTYGNTGSAYGSYSSHPPSWEALGRVSPEKYLDEYASSPSPIAPSPIEYPLESSSRSSGKAKSDSKHSQRRPSNRDEFDGPHQFLQRPAPEYIAQQERDLPHLPTNLVVHEQDSVLTRVNDRLSQCAFDFVAKYQFPIPLSSDMRPVERPQDREWTEWVYLLKRLATKRRIPARVLYNGQIKQFITILENSLEMRHCTAHQSRPLKDDRNILQLISAGIQVAKLLRDADAMSYMDQLYITTEKKIQERSVSSRYSS